MPYCSCANKQGEPCGNPAAVKVNGEFYCWNHNPLGGSKLQCSVPTCRAVYETAQNARRRVRHGHTPKCPACRKKAQNAAMHRMMTKTVRPPWMK